MFDSRQLLVGIALLLGALLAGPDLRAVDCGSVADHFSTASNRFTPGGPLCRQDVYASAAANGVTQLLPNFLPAGLNLDALHVIDSETLLFSVDVNGFAPTSAGLVRLLHDRLYRLDASGGGVAIEVDPD
jgi:hypothetical protein